MADKTVEQILAESEQSRPYEVACHTGVMLLRCTDLPYYENLADAHAVAQDRANKNGALYIVGDRRTRKIVSTHGEEN